MSTERYSKPSFKKVLVLTSSGGGGLIQTANAKTQEILEKHPGLEIVRKDLLQDWVWKPIGSYFIHFWNSAQRKGNVSKQTFCVYGQYFADIFLHPGIFCYALYTLFKEDIDHIIDTQPLGTSAIVKALRIYNRRRGKKVRLEKVLVDLPTRKATHFFSPLKRLSKTNREWVQLTTIAPLLEEGETAEQFWQSTCGFSEKQINLEDVYVRQAFRKYKGKPKTDAEMRICIHYKNSEELRLMQQTFSKGPIEASVKKGFVEFFIQPTDRMATVLLGSQPSSLATLSYIEKFAALAAQYPHIKTHLFVFCADHQEGELSLFQKAASLAEQIPNYPKNLSIILFPFQNEEAIASLFYRSDITCTRSGGQTAMELMCVSTGEIWIHSEAVQGQDLLKGIPGWESASAVYLQRLRGAKIVTPDLVTSFAHTVF